MLKQKIGQMLMFGFKGAILGLDDVIVQSILTRQLGGVILFAPNIEHPGQVKQLTRQLQDYALQAVGEPLFIGVDYEGGLVNRLNERGGFPKTWSAEDIGLWPLEQVTQCAQQMAVTLKQLGINVNFAPVLDVNVNPDNPVIGGRGRSFSRDPQRVAACAEVFSRAYQHQGIVCAYKHFPGHGSSIGDTHMELVDVTHTWKAYELEPYEQLLPHSEDHAMVMAAHVVHSGLDSEGYPASLSRRMTTGLLRNRLRFNGVVITDDLQMRAIADHYGLAVAVRLAVNAGADILIFGNQLVSVPQDPQEIIDIVYDEVMADRIPRSRIDEAYKRITKLKEKNIRL